MKQLPFVGVIAALVLSGCAGSAHPRPIRGNESSSAPRAIELYAEAHVATLHFPQGTYFFDATDSIGYYYRAPRGVIQHTAASSIARRGGIFVSKRDRRKLRGYVYLGGAVTLVGNLSQTAHAFRN